MEALGSVSLWLGATLTVELLIALALRRAVGAPSAAQLVRCTVAVNLVSFPIALLAVERGAPWAAVEGTVLVAEGLAYRQLLGDRIARPFWLAAAANVASALVGVLVA